MDVLILGCGISGLSCAIKLKEQGFERVRIVARDLPPNTTSDVAGGLWFPYKAEPIHRILGWSKTTFQELKRLQSEYPSAGITTTDFYQYFRKPVDYEAWWSSAVEVYHKLAPSELSNGFLGGYYAQVLVAEPQTHLPFLMKYFEALGGTIERGVVETLKEIIAENTIIVNCTGLDSKRLVSDTEMFSIRGQIVRVKNPGIRRSITIESSDEQSENATYTIARSEDVILGGVAMINNWDTSIDDTTIQGIVERCTEIEPTLQGAEVLGHKAGLRPGRTEIRLELEQHGDTCAVIHNYGHGGSGYTVNWGCAEEVSQLAKIFTENYDKNVAINSKK
jgi:D-amino-acid oxidase